MYVWMEMENSTLIFLDFFSIINNILVILLTHADSAENKSCVLV